MLIAQIKMLKVQLMTFVAFLAIRDRKHIEALIWVIVISVGFYGFKGGLFTILTGGAQRVWGPPDTYIHGNNELGLALTMTIPLANYLRMVSPNRWVRRGLLILMLFCAAAVLGTQSRGALLAIGAMTFVLWMRSSKKFVVGGVLLVLAAAFLTFMPKSWEDRMSTIKTYEQDSSAMSRINAWEMAVHIANSRMTGGGFFVEAQDVYLQYAPIATADWVVTAHSIYFQALGEQGWPGLFLFLCVGAGAFLATVQVRRMAKGRSDARWAFDLAGMVQVSMIGYATGGSFLSLSYLDLTYNVAVIIVACKMWLKEQRWKDEPQGLFGSGEPLGSITPPTGRFHAV
jgi:probable O-glycosylation ligase (exosortase A-associated)